MWREIAIAFFSGIINAQLAASEAAIQAPSTMLEARFINAIPIAA